MPFWVEFEDGSAGSVGLRELIEKQTGKKLKQFWQIPEYAAPLIMPETKEWTLCSSPKDKCKGKHSCPKDPVCND